MATSMARVVVTLVMFVVMFIGFLIAPLIALGATFLGYAASRGREPRPASAGTGPAVAIGRVAAAGAPRGEFGSGAGR